MSTLTLPRPVRLPLAVTVTVVVVALAVTALRGGNDRATAASASRAASTVSAAALGPVGPGPVADGRVAGSADTRAARSAAAPAPTGEVAERGVRLLAAMGLPHADPVTNADLVTAANALGVPTDGWVRAEHLAPMEDAFFQRAKPAIVGLGIPHDGHVAAHDVATAAQAVGLDVGATVEPTEVVEVLRRAPDAPLGPTPRFAVVAGINLRMPSRLPLMAGFHQASGGNVLPMQGLDHPSNAVLPSRGRGTSRVSAVDVRVPRDTTVLAPIRGTVVEVTPYALYGKYPDFKIRMVPDSSPGLLVTVLHVSDPRVQVGQHLEAGDPLAGRATLFPFESQIDRFSGRGPHVHIEARPR